MANFKVEYYKIELTGENCSYDKLSKETVNAESFDIIGNNAVVFKNFNGKYIAMFCNISSVKEYEGDV